MTDWLMSNEIQSLLPGKISCHTTSTNFIHVTKGKDFSFKPRKEGNGSLAGKSIETKHSGLKDHTLKSNCIQGQKSQMQVHAETKGS